MGELAAQAALVLDRPGQETTIGLRVPPRCEATCLPHWNGVLPAQAQAQAKWGCMRPAPGVDAAVDVDELSCCSAVSGTPVHRRHLVERAGLRSLHARAVIAPDVIISVLSRWPSSSIASTTRPTW